jgi:hypothetical protein
VLKDLFQGRRVQCRGYLEPSASIENPFGAKPMAVGVEVQKNPEKKPYLMAKRSS